MPASNKILKAKQQAANREAGIGDENGRLPSRVKPANVMVCCTICRMEIRMTRTNSEAKAHAESKHPGITFEACWPGQLNPDAAVAAEAKPSSESSVSASKASTTAAPKKQKKKEDLSFLDASLDVKSSKK